MKIKSQLTLATLIVAGLFATGCQQMQQTEGASSQQVADTGGGSTTGGATGDVHNHPEAPDCAQTKSHSHPFKDPNHKHTYGCLAGQTQVVVPKVKAKGNYKGPVAMDDASKQTMQQYQK